MIICRFSKSQKDKNLYKELNLVFKTVPHPIQGVICLLGVGVNPHYYQTRSSRLLLKEKGPLPNSQRTFLIVCKCLLE